MDDFKRLILPAIAAIVLHGFLISFTLSKQESLKPVLKGSPIKIEVNVVSRKTIVSKKKEVYKIEEIVPNAKLRKNVAHKKVIARPVSIPEPKKKIIIKPEKTQKKLVLKNKKYTIDNRHKQEDKHVNIIDKPPQKETVEKVVEKSSPADARTEKSADKIEGNLPEKKNSIASIQKKAIPIYRRNSPPPYPVMAKRRGYEGKIVLSVLVDSEGMVSKLKIKHSSGHLSLDRAALKTVKTWLFISATKGGKPVAMWVDVPIEFQLM